MWAAPPSSWDVDALAASWRAARPFPHVVLDDLVDAEALGALRAAFDDEPADEIHDEIFSIMASARTPAHPAFQAFSATLGATDALAAVAAITGRAPARVELRAYAYMPGHYLLPHVDYQAGVGRVVAFAFYVDASDLEGGELELFDCDLEGGEIVATRSARLLAPAPNRCVLFDVGDASLHQVREVTRGARLSLAGWFYP